MDTHLMFESRKTCLEMLHDRNYTIPEYLFNVTEKEFNMEFEFEKIHKLKPITDIIDTNGHFVTILMISSLDKNGIKEEIWPQLNTIFKDSIKEYTPSSVKDKELELVIDNYVTQHELHVIIIMPAFDWFKKDYAKYIGQHRFIEMYDYHQMFINPTKHIFQPKWRLLKPKEINDLMQRYDASRINLGSVCLDDPINRYYGGRPVEAGQQGDIYEIIRDGTSIFYRKVIGKRMNLETNKTKSDN